MPSLLNAELPFRYPASLYTRRVQGNVTLRIFIDRDGRRRGRLDVASNEPSGYPALDSAALAGARDLRFVPAKAHGEPIRSRSSFPCISATPKRGRSPATRRCGATTRGSGAS